MAFSHDLSASLPDASAASVNCVPPIDSSSSRGELSGASLDFSGAYYTRKQIAFISAVRPKQLEWWEDQGFIVPQRIQKKVLYTRHQLFGVLLIREMMERGFTLNGAGSVWKQIQDRPDKPGEGFLRWLLTNGERAVLLEHPDVVIAFLEQRRNPTFVLISLAAIVERLEEGTKKVARRAVPRERVARIPVKQISFAEYAAKKQERWA